jgi:hypothetical protein
VSFAASNFPGGKLSCVIDPPRAHPMSCSQLIGGIMTHDPVNPDLRRRLKRLPELRRAREQRARGGHAEPIDPMGSVSFEIAGMTECQG